MVPTATRLGRLVLPATGAWVVIWAIIPDFVLKLDIYICSQRLGAVKLVTRLVRLIQPLPSIRISAMSTPVIIVYSDDSSTREVITGSLGKRLSPELPEHEIKEFATGPALRLYLDNGGKADLFILDGEAVPEGGMGIARQLKDEIFNCPPVLLIVARREDNWLASWSRAEDVAIHPIDPFTFGKKAAALLAAQISTTH